LHVVIVTAITLVWSAAAGATAAAAAADADATKILPHVWTLVHLLTPSTASFGGAEAKESSRDAETNVQNLCDSAQEHICLHPSIAFYYVALPFDKLIWGYGCPKRKNSSKTKNLGAKVI
jgi:hypothetical protein